MCGWKADDCGAAAGDGVKRITEQNRREKSRLFACGKRDMKQMQIFLFTRPIFMVILNRETTRSKCMYIAEKFYEFMLY